MIRIEVHEGIDGKPFEEAKAEWRQLSRSTHLSPFLSWEWMSTWFDHFGGCRTAFLLKAYRDNKVIGILPMFHSDLKPIRANRKRLALMGEGPGGADHLDLICDPGDFDDAFFWIMSFLLNRREFDSINFDSLAGGSQAIGLLKRISHSKGCELERFAIQPAGFCPQIDLSTGWESVLNNGKRAANFKRRLKKIEKRPDFEFRTVVGPEGAGAAFERFLRLHQRRWEQSGGSELTGHPKLEDFQRALVPRMAQAGLVRFDEIWLDGECRSSVYGFDDGRTFYYYNSGYDLDYADLSVGLVLIGLSIKSAVERGNKVYDFLRGDETYKFDWANKSIEIVNVSVCRPSFSMAVADNLAGLTAKLNKIGRAVLPKGLAASIANRRRAWRREYQLSER